MGINLKILIVLAYWNRPNMVKNALNSIKEMNYDNWELAFIDDGSDPDKIGEPIVRDILQDHLHKIKFIRSTTKMEERVEQGHHGLFMNYAIVISEADVVITLCDDDAITKDYFTNINNFFTNNPNEVWGYSHCVAFDPTTQDYHDAPLIANHFTDGHTGRIAPACNVDSSQVACRTKCTRQDGVYWNFPQTWCLDQSFFEKMYAKYGACPFMGCIGQYKGIFSDQMGKRGIFKPNIL